MSKKLLTLTQVTTLFKALKMAFQDSGTATEYTASQLQLGDRAVGSAAQLVNPDNTLSPLPDGKYRVTGEDFVFTVKDGLIASIGEDMAETPVDPAVDPATPVEDPEKKPEAMAAAPEDFEARIAAIESTLNGLVEKIDKVLGVAEAAPAEENFATAEAVNKIASQFAEIQKVVMLFAEMPAQESQTSRNPDSKLGRFNKSALFNKKS